MPPLSQPAEPSNVTVRDWLASRQPPTQGEDNRRGRPDPPGRQRHRRGMKTDLAAPRSEPSRVPTRASPPTPRLGPPPSRQRAAGGPRRHPRPWPPSPPPRPDRPQSRWTTTPSEDEE